MEIKSRDSGFIVMRKDGLVEKKRASLISCSCTPINVRKSRPYLYKLEFYRENNQLFFLGINADRESTFRDFLLFKRRLETILVSSGVREVIALSVGNSKLQSFLLKEGFEAYDGSRSRYLSITDSKFKGYRKNIT